MPFINSPVAVEQVDANVWRTTRPIHYVAAQTPAPEFVDVSEGYRTDFATIPRFIWWLCPRYGRYTAATVVHDYLLTDKLNPDGFWTSRRIDYVFRDAMAELGVSFPRRWLMWAGVRWGAIANKDRRAGSLATLPGVLLISLLALPLLLPALAVIPSLLIFALLERTIN